MDTTEPAQAAVPVEPAGRAGSVDLPAEAMARRMRAELARAMKGRDQPAVAALRGALAAIANAEAPPVHEVRAPVTFGRLVDHPRLLLSTRDVERVLRQEIELRARAVHHYVRAGRGVDAAVLEAEISVLRTYLA